MNRDRTINEYLAEPSLDLERAARFDAMIERVSFEARTEMLGVVIALKAQVYNLGEIGAKSLVIQMHEFFNLPEPTQRQAAKHGVWMLSLQD